MDKRAFFYIIFLLIWGAFATGRISAQTPEISFRHLSTVDGLSNFTVLSIVQDRQGFMWFGTMDGLNRYDGTSIKIYREEVDDSTSLGSNIVHALACSSDSGIWVGTKKGLFYYNYCRDDFRPVPMADSAGNNVWNVIIRDLLVDGDWLWVATSYGLYRYNMQTQSPEPLRSDQVANELMDSQVFALIKDDHGVMWIGTGKGFFKYQNGNFQQVENPPGMEGTYFRILSLAEDANGRIWVGTDDTNSGIYILDLQTNAWQNISKETGHIPHNKANELFRLDDGTIWVGTTWGLAIIDENTLDSRILFYDKMSPEGLSQNSIKSFFQDQNGLIWIGTFSGGVNYFDPRSQKIRHFSSQTDDKNSLSFDIVSFIYEDRARKLWIGTEYGGVNVYDPVTGNFNIYQKSGREDGLINDNIKSILEGPDGRMFIATQFGLSIYNPGTGKFFNFGKDPTPRGTLGWTPLHDVCLDDQGDVWIGSTGKFAHLSKYDTRKDTLLHFIPPKTSFPVLEKPETISMVFDSANGVFWSGGDNGLFAFDINTSTYVQDSAFFKVADKLKQVVINDILLDKHGLLWIATFGRGLFILDTQNYQLRNILTSDGLDERSFYALVCDNAGNMWVSANASLYKLKMPVHVADPITAIDKLDAQEGFPAQQYFRSAAGKDHLGRLYFGGDKGFVAFDPQEVKNIVLHPKVIIKDVVANGQSVTISKGRHQCKAATRPGVTLSYWQSSFMIRFIGPNYINPGNTWYQYRLKNEDESWQDLGNAQTISFSKLGSGNYDLQIRASSDNGNYDNSFTSYHITVLPPFWATPWAYAAYIVLILVLLYVFFTITRRWERLSQNLKFEHLQREQEKQFSQQRLKFFTDISHELRTPLTLILAPLKKIVASNYGNAKIKNQLMLMMRNGDRMLQLINQLLDLRKMETGHAKLQVAAGNIVQFIKEVSLTFREAAHSRGIKFYFESDSEKIDVWFDRDKMEVVLYNLLSNALKYTPDHGKMTISVKNFPTSTNGGAVRISVENSGKGIPEDQLSQIFDRYYAGATGAESGVYSSGVGLEIVRNIMELHKAKIEVTSSYDKNGYNGKTCFIISLKKGKEHFSEEEIIKNYKSSEDIKNYKHAEKWRETVTEVHESQKESPDENGLEKATSHPQTILVVEDNAEVRHLVKSIFADEFNVLEAGDGKQALSMAAEKMPDLVISDIMMPEMDGIELCGKIKSQLATSHIPVILLTARTAVTFKYEGLETGADDYIVKPFDAEDLRLRAINIIHQREKIKEKFSKSRLALPQEVSVTSIDEKLLQHAIDYIAENMDKVSLTVELVARNAGMSRTNFYRKIRALTGLTPAEFLRKVKMDRAAALLQTNKFRVSEVRQMVGISDADYFRSCFKKEFGVTPKDFLDRDKNMPSS